MSISPNRNCPSLLVIALTIIMIHGNLPEAFASPSPVTSVNVAPPQQPVTPGDGEKQAHRDNARYYHANPPTPSNGNQHVLKQLQGAAPRGVGNRNQQAAVQGRRFARNVRVPRVELGQSGEDLLDYDYGKENLQVDPLSSFNPRKRGFSVLARWKPFTNISKLRVSSRQQQQQLLRPTMVQQAQAQQMLSSAADDYDVISAETRALLLRPSGQPLRWG